MSEPARPLRLPPVARTVDGRLRRVGVEIELIGLELPVLSALVAEEVGGQVEVVNDDEHVVHGDAAGPWGVELDFELLKRLEHEAPEVPTDARARVEELAREVLRAGAHRFVPFEIVAPPLPLDRLDRVQSLIVRLRDAGALGTRAGWTHAFGLQLNVELPDLRASTIRRYLQAFLCLEDWLVERARVDFTRELTRFAGPFSKAYARTVTGPGYAPATARIIEDYLAANPTRNRTLDMLPLFLHLDEERVRRRVDDPRVKARPALHYRLPNCEVDEPDWGLHVAWNDWLEVEALAAEPDRLTELCELYQRHLDAALDRLLGSWPDEVDAWLSSAR